MRQKYLVKVSQDHRKWRGSFGYL